MKTIVVVIESFIVGVYTVGIHTETYTNEVKLHTNDGTFFRRLKTFRPLIVVPGAGHDIPCFGEAE